MTTLAIASNTWRECVRRPFTYVSAITIVTLALVSTLLRPVTFGAGAPEAINLGISTVLLAALAAAAFLGTGLVRADIERGTFLLVMSQPVGLPPYVAGRFLGLLAATLLLCTLTAGGVVGVLALAGRPGQAGPLVPAALLSATLRVFLAVLILSAATIALSALASRLFAPVLLLALFVAGDAAAGGPLGRVLPAFGLFGLEAGRSPPMGWLALYAVFYSVVFLVITYLRLTLRAPIRAES